ncbi:MAG: prepilin peptidase [Desulfobacteraceae bacterium]|jgi:leader peptidase (prepilin peptidase)/N-methyltransferase
MMGTVSVIFAILFGLCLGSFLNVCIYRIPLKKSIVNPPSSCPQCHEKIRFYDNIPLISYMLLLGKCRHCGSRIPFHYPVVEGVTGLLSAALFIRFGLSPPYFLFLMFSASLVTISFIDLHNKIIPDVISLPGILAGLAVSFLRWTPISWTDSLIGIVGGGGFLYLVAAFFERLTGRQGMGGGDIKLLAMMGAWMGWQALPFILLISSLTGTLIGGGSLLIARQGMRTRIPFGPFLALGALIYFFFGYELVSWFYRLGA